MLLAPAASDRRAALDAVLAKMKPDDWRRLRKQLLAFALFRSKSPDLAEDLVQRAMEKLLDPRGTPWDPAKQPVLARFMMSLVNSALSAERTRASARDVPLDDDPEDDAEHRDARAFSEDRAVERDRDARRLALLRQKNEGDAAASALLPLMLDGLETPAALATATGKSVDEVIAIRRRILRRAAEVSRALDGDARDDEEVA